MGGFVGFDTLNQAFLYMKEAYTTKKEKRKQDRVLQHNHLNREKMKKRVVLSSISLAVFGAVLYGIIFLVRLSTPQSNDFSTAFPIQGRHHIAVGEETKQYNSNPPSSGDHYGQTARGGFYDETLDDETVIHNLEHGDIWITYHPRISSETKAILKKFAGQYVVVSPRTQNDRDISVVAWDRVDTFDIDTGVLDVGRIQDFIRSYDNRGPEKVRGVQVGHGNF